MPKGFWIPDNLQSNLVTAANLFLTVVVLAAASGITWVVNETFYQPTYNGIQAVTKQAGRPADGQKIGELSFVCRDDKKLPNACLALYKAITEPAPPPPLVAKR